MGWHLAITRQQYIEVYRDTPAMESIELFTEQPNTLNSLLEKGYLASRLWRLNNLYYIIDKAGKTVVLRMSIGQHMVYSATLRHNRIVVLKSRQQGISTFVLMLYYDMAITNANSNVGITTHRLESASSLKSKIEFASKHMSSGFENICNAQRDRQNKTLFKLTNGSSVMIAPSFRSGTLQYVLISEYGKISALSPEKASEIMTGTLQAVGSKGLVIIESTAEGADFKAVWNNSSMHPTNSEAYMQVFLSWVHDLDCNSDAPYVPDDKECEDYFAELAVSYEAYYGIPLVLRDSQKSWWKNKFIGITMNRDRNHMGQEYPAVPKEAFEASDAGTIYAKLYHLHIAGKNEVTGLYDPMLPTYCGVDIGFNDTAVFIFFQTNNMQNDIRIVGELHDNGEGIEYYINRIPYQITYMFLPHDANHSTMNAPVSINSILQQQGFTTIVIPKTNNVMTDIEIVRSSIPLMKLDSGLLYIKEMFLSYSKEWSMALGNWKDRPKHDEWSNPADAMRTGVLGMKNYILSSDKPKERETRQTVIYGGRRSRW